MQPKTCTRKIALASSIMFVAIVVLDITTYNYLELFKQVINIYPWNQNPITEVDVVALEPITDVEQLNLALSKTYSSIRHILTDSGYDLRMPIDVLFNTPPSRISKNYEKVHQSSDVIRKIDVFQQIPRIDIMEYRPISTQKPASLASEKYDVSAVGGTFDHIHDGHKILLSVAAFLAEQRLIVGVTGQQLLEKKKFPECLEPLQVRIDRTIAFINRVLQPSVRYDIYEINDVCGPTGFVSDIDCLIVSQESAKGGDYVNNYRRERGLSLLKVITIKVVGEDGGSEQNSWKGKISSTDIREIISNSKR